MDLLLLSNSRTHGYGYLEHVRDELTDFLAGVTDLAFVPYALRDHDAYTTTVADALRPYGVAVTGVHTAPDPVAALVAAQAVFVGGGNSFRLLKTLQDNGLRDAIADRARSGAVRYMGASAGTNMACPTLRTTNDMPIAEPATFDALGLVPFQINPHYVDPDPSSTHMGETREQRITEFLEQNDVPVLGIREGGLLRVRDGSARLGGIKGARLFARDAEPREFAPGDDVSFLLSGTPRFDAPA